MNYIGIDNGLDGGIVVLRDDGSILHKEAMPTLKVGKGREIDTFRVQTILKEFPGTVIIEPAQKFSPGKMALCSTWFSFGIVLTVSKLTGRRFELINPPKWQKAFWTRPKMPKGQKFDTKAAALAAAGRLWPAENWLKNQRCTTPHDGIIDAALIAEYARRANL